MNVRIKFRLVALAVVSALLLFSGVAFAQADEEYDDDDPSALTDFHDALDSVGAWVDDPTYGTIWVPTAGVVGADFVPYQTGGHWAYDDDYSWVSDWGWGWAPFHYGRWVFIDGRGWSWIPGRRWAPSWVTWRTGLPGFGGWVGWGPLAPTWGWRDGVAFRFGFNVAPRFGYCERDHLFDHEGLHGHMLNGPQADFVGTGMRDWAGRGNDGHRGPPPESIGIPKDRVPHDTDPGNKKAKEFGNPSKSSQQGGHPPAPSTHKGKDPGAPDHYPNGPDKPKPNKGGGGGPHGNDHGSGEHGGGEHHGQHR
jgi:hypothetical protein